MTDYTKVPRELIYKDRRSLEEFFDENDINETLVDNISNIYFMKSNFKERALKCMNMAYYLCTLIMNEKHPEWVFDTYSELACWDKERVNIHQAVTLSLVYIYLHGLKLEEEKAQRLQKLLKELNNYLITPIHFIQRGDPFLKDVSYNDILNQLRISHDYTIDEKVFAFRYIDKDTVTDVMRNRNFNWSKLTNFWEERSIRDLVKAFGITEEEKHNMVVILRQTSDTFYASGPRYEEVRNMLNGIDEEIRYQYSGETVNTTNNGQQTARIIEQEKAIVQLKAEIEELKKNTTVTQEEFDKIFGDDNVEHHKNVSVPQSEQEKTIKAQTARIKELEETIADYAAKYDPTDLKKNKFMSMTAKQHVILFLAELAYNDRLPNNRKNMSWILSFISGRNESSTKDALARKITQEECNNLASIFCKDTENPESTDCPFLANIIRELPQKIKQDISEKNTQKALR